MNIHYSYLNNCEIISLVEQTLGVFEIKNLKDYLPHVIFSDEVPKTLDFKIDGLMGEYDPISRSITIYLQGIFIAEQRLKQDFSEVYANNSINLYAELLEIVLLHELGHWMFHHIDLSNHHMEKLPFAPVFINDMVDEWVAQSFTYQCVKDVPDLNATLSNLSKNQPYEYKTFNDEKYDKYLSQTNDCKSWRNFVGYLQYYEKKIKPTINNENMNDLGEVFNLVNTVIETDKYNI